jgi:hypothetical protein
MHTTSRLGLEVPDTSDNESVFPAVSSQQMTTLDNAVIVTEGTLASRPTSGSYVGQTYYATDALSWYFWTGSAWETALLAGAWQSTTPGTNVLVSPHVRLEGDLVRFAGSFAVSTTVSSGATLCTLSSGYYPTSGPAAFTFAAQTFSITTGGVLTSSANVSASIEMNGATFALSFF